MTPLSQLKSMLLAVMFGLSACAQASAQFGGNRINRPIDTPTFSPYLNMFRGGAGGGGPALNYYGLVRPQQEFAQQNQQLGEGLQALQMQQLQGMQVMPGAGLYGYSQLGTTGHAVAFNSFRTSHFAGAFTAGGGGYGGGGYGGGGYGGGGYGGGGYGGGGYGGAGYGGGFGGGGFGGGGFGGGGFGGGGFGGGGFGGTGFSGVSGHPSSFGNIVQPGVGVPGGR